MRLKFTNPVAFTRGWQRKALSLLVLTMAASLVVGATSLERYREQNETARVQAMDHGQAITHEWFLLRRLPPGEGEWLRLELGQELRNEIMAIRDLGKASDPGTRNFSEILCAWMMRDLHRNPDCYLPSAPRLRNGERAAWNALQASGSTQFTVPRHVSDADLQK